MAEYVEIAQEAFTRNEPTQEDVLDHVIADTLVEAAVEDDPVAFSGTDYLEDERLVLGSGMAVRPGFQKKGIGSIIRTRGIAEDLFSDGNGRPRNPFLRKSSLADETGYFAARSANPAILGHMQQHYGAFPRQGEEIPSDVREVMSDAAREIDPGKEFEAPVMVEAYPGQMNNMPEHRLSEYLESLMEHNGSGYDEGDALIIAARLEQSDLENTYENLLESTGYEVREEVV